MSNRSLEPPIDPVHIAVHRDHFVQILGECLEEENLLSLKKQVSQLRKTLLGQRPAVNPPWQPDTAESTISFRKDTLLSELDQILAARTLQRAKYYLLRLKTSAEQVKIREVNDINLLRWKEYDQIITDSLWIFKRRDTSGAHLAWYWGNFIPQIPRQMILRYTKAGDWVLDPFVGSGTTLIECRRLGRNGLGIELNAEIARQAQGLIEKEPNLSAVVSDVIVGDSTVLDFCPLLRERGLETVQLLIMHPPYHDIIRFSDDPRDLSNATSVEGFLDMFGQVVERTYPILDGGRYLAVVIGDKYTQGEWVPLGFYVMQEVLSKGYTLKSIVVKNFEETRAKRQQQELWRYRALAGGFYVFKHEYILIFKKPAGSAAPASSSSGSPRPPA